MKNIFYILSLLSTTILAQKPEVVIDIPHVSNITGTAISKDGKWLATSSADKTYQIRDLKTKKLFRSSQGKNFRLEQIKFNPSSKYISFVQEGEKIIFETILKGKLLSEFEIGTSHSSYDYCGESEVIFVNDNAGLTVANFVENKILRSFDYLETPEKNDIILHVKIHPNDNNTAYVLCMNNQNPKERLFKLKEIDVSNLTTKKEIVLEQVSKMFKKRETFFIRLMPHPDGKSIMILDDGESNGKETFAYVYSTNKLSLLRSKKISEHRIYFAVMTSKSNELLFMDPSNQFKTLDYRTLKETKSISGNNLLSFTTGSNASFDKEETALVLPGSNNLVTYNLKSGTFSNYNAGTRRVASATYDQIGKYFCTVNNSLEASLWDLEQNKVIDQFQALGAVRLSPNKRDLAYIDMLNIAVKDLKTSVVSKINLSPMLVQDLQYSSDGNNIAAAALTGELIWLDASSLKIINKSSSMGVGTFKLAVQPNSDVVAMGYSNKKIHIVKASTGLILKSFDVPVGIVHALKFSEDGKKLAICDHTDVLIYDTDNWELSQTLKGHKNGVKSVDFDMTQNIIVTGGSNGPVLEADNSVKVWNLENGEEIFSFKEHKGGLVSVIIDKISNHVYSTDELGITKVWSLKDKKEIASMLSGSNKNYIVFTPDNYYMSSKGALKQIAFKIKDRLFSFDQFDLKLNRPDIICSRLDKTPQGLIDAYNYLHKKRLRKMNVPDIPFDEDYNLPEINIASNSVELISKSEKYKFTVNCKDEISSLNQILVYVNGVPINSSKFDLAKHKTKSIEMDIDVILADRVNNIQVSVLNEKGAESLRENISVIYEGERNQGKLFLIAIGVSKYEMSDFNLKYAAKDATDLTERLTNQNREFRDYEVHLIKNENATKENILALEAVLSEAKPEDAVVFFIAGHGLLDEDLNYFFATYNTDFNNPSQNGISYEQLEKLLSNTRAYNKLLLMDTCHSGELDKDEVEKAEAADTKIGDVSFRNAGVGVRQKNGFGLEDANNMLENMFADVRQSSGANVISSSGGVELSMESDIYQNGLFTYAVLDFIQKQSAVQVSTLRENVYLTVTKLSQGKQKPSARAENISNDFVVIKK